MENQILVLGATGKTGKRIARKLQQLNIPIREGSRKGYPPFDWDMPNSWSAVLENIQTVYINVQPDFAVAGVLEKVQSFVEAAKQSGIQKLVLLSGRGEEKAQEGEKMVMDSGLEWTVLRSSWFMQNFSENFFLDSILHGQLIVPKVNALEPFVDLDDLADVAVAALTDSKHQGRIFELTGPELLSFADTIRIISEVTGRPIGFQEVPMDNYLEMLREYQTPEDIVWLLEYLFTNELDGRNESLSDDIENVLKKKPTSFKEYAMKTAKTGIWEPK